jgi:hypothetical protein
MHFRNACDTATSTYESLPGIIITSQFAGYKYCALGRPYLQINQFFLKQITMQINRILWCESMVNLPVGGTLYYTGFSILPFNQFFSRGAYSCVLACVRKKSTEAEPNACFGHGVRFLDLIFFSPFLLSKNEKYFDSIFPRKCFNTISLYNSLKNLNRDVHTKVPGVFSAQNFAAAASSSSS